MIFIEVPTAIKKIIMSKSTSSKKKYNNFIEELKTSISDGKYYKQYKGECLLFEAKRRKVNNCTPYSIELEYRLRLVYEVYNNYELNGVKYSSYVIITDLANHEWRGIPYTRQFSDTERKL